MRIEVVLARKGPFSHAVICPEFPIEILEHALERCGFHPGPGTLHVVPVPEQEVREGCGHSEVCCEELDYPSPGIKRLWMERVNSK